MTKKFVLSIALGCILSVTSSPVRAQAGIQAQAVGGSNPTPQAVGGSNPTPQAVGGSNPTPQIVSWWELILGALGY